MSLKSSAQIQMELAERVKELRLQRNWSQEELARRSGIQTPTYRLFEQSGKISLQRFLKIVEVLGRAGELDRLLRLQPALPSIRDLEKSKRARGRTKR